MRYFAKYNWLLLLVLQLIALTQMSCSSSSNTTDIFGYLVNDNIIVDVNDDINRLLNEFTDSEKVSGNTAELLIDGPDSYEAFVNLIKSAQKSINIETLDFDDDSNQPENISLEFIQLLTEKAKQGIPVKVVVDKTSQMFLNPDLPDKLIAGGVDVKYYSVPQNINPAFPRFFYHTHKKLLIIDGKQAIVGGMNFGYRYFGPEQWRDTNVLLQGPIVASLQRQFFRDWETLGGQASNDKRFFPELGQVGETNIRAIDQKPAQNDFDINNAVLIALRSAKHKIDIETPYFNPSKWLADEIKAACKRGIEIRILTNSEESNDITESFMISAYNFEEMLKLGIRVFVWNAQNRTMHSKVMTVDDSFAMIGSYNFNRRSIMWDAEDAVIFTDSESVNMFSDMLDNDFNSETAFEITIDWINSRDKQERQSWKDWQILNWLF